MKYKLCASLLALLGLSGAVQAEPGDERILAAREAATRGDSQRLVAMAASTSDHVLEPYVQYWPLSARIARISEPAPAEAISDFLRRNAGTWLAEKLRQEWVKRLAYEKRWGAFEAEYGLLMQPDQEAQCWAAQSGGSYAADAGRALEGVWLTMMDTPAACDAPLQALVSSGRLGSEDVWQRFRRLVEAKRFNPARDAASWLPENQSPSPASLTVALENPARFLASANARNPNGRGGREVVLAAIARLARSNVRDAVVHWRGLESSAYRDEERAYVWGQLAWMAALAQMPEASAWFAQAQGTLMTDEQRAWRVRVALRAGNWAGVRQGIEAMPAAQQELPDWSYWLGRALQAQGKSAEARMAFLRAADQPHFYGILSTEALGRQYIWPKAAAPVTQTEIVRVQNAPETRRVLALYRLDLRTEALREWAWGLRSVDDRTLLAAAEVARRNGLYDRAINAAERTRNEHDFALRYLAPYYDVFAREAQAQALDLPWVFGLVRQESRFLSIARSGVGAQGLMQVMPATGKWIAKRQGWGDYHSGWLTAIDTNVQVGSAYLRHVLDTLANHPVLASAAYNAGPGRARRWRDSKPLEGAIYTETIPFTETRDYVKKVMANAEMYATLLERRPVSLTTRLGKVPANTTELALAPDEP
ncbi:transglycosylase SLT domain-containing protein [Uliginosibacterium sp. 31-16]|uniref:lytic transglycosylase domain-containing protein n=1 Tax=Uliginosibacterium sp. 31-16 TaxID=3068315 RepID=UPI00273F9730|nr:lytic transglycosylase domain-containing protein [Uliginosibacterium sp. 31-16]MDP5239020.1 transglycosylase SLT domain-containing protein [Uliginosibacterium sp. 31-16]